MLPITARIKYSSSWHVFPFSSFILRCILSATLSCWLSSALGLDHIIWAAMSALIVSQENFEATRRHVGGRIAGTCIGAAVALLIHQLLIPFHPTQVTEIALAVGICASIAWGRPVLRVCLWTCPLILLMTSSLETPGLTAWSRTVEVFLGALIGGLLHYLETIGLRWLGLLQHAHKRKKQIATISADD